MCITYTLYILIYVINTICFCRTGSFTRLYIEKTVASHENGDVQQTVRQHLYDIFYWSLDRLSNLKQTKELRKKAAFPDECDFSTVPFVEDLTITFNSILINWFIAINNILSQMTAQAKFLKSKKG